MIQTDENWARLCTFFPAGWRAKAFELGACRRLRAFGSVDELFRLLLVYLGEGHSLKQTCAIARQAGWADISAVSLMKRLRKAGSWFQWMTRELISRHHPGQINLQRPDWLAGRPVKSIDATVVCEPGSTGTDWRVHYALELFGLQCDQLTLTDPNVGEKVDNFQFAPGELVLGDRAYCSGKAFRSLASQQIDWLLRYKHRSFPVVGRSAEQQQAELLDFLERLPPATPGEMKLQVDLNPALPLRLIALAKSEQAAEQARQAYRYNQRRKQKPINEHTLKLQDYIIVVTSLTNARITAPQLLQLYRMRWQIELAFKRLKSVVGLGHLPNQDPQSCRAWLHGKLLIALLVDLIVEEARLFSPWGYPLEAASERVVLMERD